MLNSFKSSMIKKIFIFILFLTIISPSIVFADGGMFFYDLYDEANILTETDQLSYINFDNGIQKMIIAVNAQSIKQAKSIIWLFPLPASPEKIKIDIINKLPSFNGGLLKGHFLKYYDQLVNFLLYTQFFRFIITILESNIIELSNTNESENNILLTQRIEKLGLTTELISAKNSDSLENYLKNKKISVPQEFKKILNDYINNDYSFVISYVSNLEKFSKIDHQLGIYVTFPTNKIFFPLKPTSIYGNLKIPIKIFALNYVEPEILNNKVFNIKTKYNFNNNIQFGEEFNDFFFNKNINNNLRYTSIEIASAANRLTDDLWIISSGPKPYIFQYMIDYYYISAFLIWVILSCISSSLAAFLAFGDLQINKKMFFIFGAFNLLSLLAIIIMSFILRVDIKYTNLKPINNNFSLKNFIILSILLSICFIYLTFHGVQSFEIIFRDMGDAKLPFLANLMVKDRTLFYVLIYAVSSTFLTALSFSLCKNTRLTVFFTAFTIFFHFLTGMLSYAINNVF